VLEPMATAVESVVLAAGPDVLVLVDVNCRPTIIEDRAGYVARLQRVLARADVVKASDEDLAWLRPDGHEMTHDDWHRGENHVLGMLISGEAADEVDERGRPVRVANWIHLLAEAMGLPYTDDYKLWRNAETPRDAVGADVERRGKELDVQVGAAERDVVVIAEGEEAVLDQLGQRARVDDLLEDLVQALAVAA